MIFELDIINHLAFYVDYITTGNNLQIGMYKERKMNMKKYELTSEKFQFLDHTLYRIRAVRDFGDVKKGELGGFIESEDNLSHKGNAWVAEEAKVLANASVAGDAQVRGNAIILGTAHIWESALVEENVFVYGSACIYGNSKLFGNCCLYGDTRVFDDAEISGNAKLNGAIWIGNGARITGRNQYLCINPVGENSISLSLYSTSDGIRAAYDGRVYSVDELTDKFGNDKFISAVIDLTKMKINGVRK